MPRLFASVVASSLLGAALAGTNDVGKAFLAEQEGKEGVVKLPSGLMYKVLKAGEGEDHPTVDSPCECHYAGTTPSLTPDAIDKDEADWSEFDSSYKRGSPTTFAPNQVIKGWTEAMQLMVEGDKWEMYIPSELGYGDGGQGGKIQGAKKPADKCDPATGQGCNDKQKAYVDKQGKATPEKRKAELKRLEGMQGGEMKPENHMWLMSRIKLLGKMVKKDEL